MATLALALVALALTGAAAQGSMPSLPLFPALPDPCGRVEQVGPARRRRAACRRCHYSQLCRTPVDELIKSGVATPVQAWRERP
jgi:hypothetical protein